MESSLTRILKPSLCGNARIAIVCCISPPTNMSRRLATLHFATSAKLVKIMNPIIRHEDVEDPDLVSTL